MTWRTLKVARSQRHDDLAHARSIMTGPLDSWAARMAEALGQVRKQAVEKERDRAADVCCEQGFDVADRADLVRILRRRIISEETMRKILLEMLDPGDGP